MVEKTLTLSRGDIPYLEAGSGPVLLFFHGAIAMPRAYIQLIDLLSRHFTVIAPTHPGHGNAFPIDRQWKLTDFIDTYREFISALAVTPRILTGHSFGGTFSLLLSRYFPDVSVIAFDPPGLPLPLTVNEYVKFMVDEARDLLAARPGLETLTETAKASGTLFYTISRHPQDVWWFSEHTPVLDLRSDLPELTSPIALFWGIHDDIVPVANGREMARLLPHATLTEFPDLGHVYPVTEPEFTCREMENVLKGWRILP